MEQGAAGVAPPVAASGLCRLAEFELRQVPRALRGQQQVVGGAGDVGRALQGVSAACIMPASLALGAGVALAGIAIASANDQPRHRHYDRRSSYGHGRPHS